MSSAIYWWRAMLNTAGGKHVDPEKPGEPEILTDPETGDVTSYENTGEVTVETADTTIDTEFVPFDGKDWELHIYAHFAYSELTDEYPTLLCCMKNSSPWPGITIRWEDSSTVLYIICNDDAGSKHYYTTSTDSDGNVNITMTYTNNAITIVNNGTTLATNQSLVIDLSDLTLALLADVNSTTGESRRFGIGTIYEFYIKKT